RADLAALVRLERVRPEIAPDVVEVTRQVQAIDAYFAAEIALADRGRAGRLQAQNNVLNGTARFDRLRAAAKLLLARSQQILRVARADAHATFLRSLVLDSVVAGVAAAILATMLVVLPGRMRRLYAREQEARLAAERGARASRALAHVNDAVVLLDREDTIRS